MIRRPPRSTRTYTLFPTRRSSDLSDNDGTGFSQPCHRRRIFIPVTVLRYGEAAAQGRPPRGQQDILDRSRDTVQTAFRRSEEHTSELQSLMRISYAVFCLKKKKSSKDKIRHYIPHNSRSIH